MESWRNAAVAVSISTRTGCGAAGGGGDGEVDGADGGTPPQAAARMSAGAT